METPERLSVIPTFRRKASKTHPDHNKLTEVDRFHLAILMHLAPQYSRFSMRDKHSTAAIAREFGVSPKTARNCRDRYFSQES